MAFDSVAVAAVVAEAWPLLHQARVNKIQQPGALELVLSLYARTGPARLVLSAHPAWARIHLTRTEFKNPPSPPTFCMRLRKLLEGARLAALRQIGRERIVHLEFAARDELGNPVLYTLVAEVMGKRSNLVLLGPGGRILDAARRVTEETNRHREILPGVPYLPPPASGKVDPAVVSGQELAEQATHRPGRAAWEIVLAAVDGIGPLLARDVTQRCGTHEQAGAGLSSLAWEQVAAACRELAVRVQRAEFTPHLLWDGSGQLVDFSALAIAHWAGRCEPQPTMSTALDRFYAVRQEQERRQSLRATLERAMRTTLERVYRRRDLQAADLARAENAEELRECGELLRAHLHAVPRGATAADVPDYYRADGGSRSIALDPSLSPAQNARDYFRRYQKARASHTVATARLDETGSELLYLEQVEVALAEADSLPDLAEIQRELVEQGYLAGSAAGKGGQPGPAVSVARGGPPGGGATGRNTPATRPLVVKSGDGLEIWVGRNNRQNDALTLKLAHSADLWLHTKDIAGAHVVVRVPPGGEVPETTLLEAALLAAFHSRARGSSQVPVDYTQRKHVRKPAGARPGLVIYDHHRTVYVTPDPEQHPILRAAAPKAPPAPEPDPS